MPVKNIMEKLHMYLMEKIIFRKKKLFFFLLVLSHSRKSEMFKSAACILWLWIKKIFFYDHEI